MLCGLCLALGACAELAPPGATPPAPEQPPSTGRAEAPGEAQSSELLGLMERLAVASEEQWAAMRERVAGDESAPEDAGQRLRLALVLSAPGRAGGNDARAAEILQELVSQPNTLSDPEVRVARLRLAEIRARTDLRQRVHALEDDVAELEEKIRALTRIEETVAPTGGVSPGQ